MHGPWLRGAACSVATIPLFLIWAALAAYSVVANFQYGQTIGAGEARTVISFGGALADAVKLIIPLFIVAITSSDSIKLGIPKFTFPIAVIVFSLWSLFCSVSLQMQAVSDQHTGTIAVVAEIERIEAKLARHDIEARRLTTALSDHATRIATLRGELARPRETIEAEIATKERDPIFTRGSGRGPWSARCTQDESGESRTFCDEWRALKAEAETARPSAEIRADIRAETDRRDATSASLAAEGEARKATEAELAAIDRSAAERELDPGLAMLVSWATPSEAQREPQRGDSATAADDEESKAAEATARLETLQTAIRGRAIFFGALLEAAMAIVGVMISAMLGLAQAAFAENHVRASLAAEQQKAAAKEAAAAMRREQRRAIAAKAATAPRPARRKLSDGQEREAFRLKYRDRKSLKLIADQFGVSPTTIGDAVARVAERALAGRNDDQRTPAALADELNVSVKEIEKALSDAVARRKKALKTVRKAA